MVKIIPSTVFNINCDAIVNTVNCDGVMGAGLALEFSLRYPNMFDQYVNDCKSKIVKVGYLIKYEDDGQMIINFPTKISWRFPSNIKWIEQGLRYFSQNYKNLNISSIAFPPLGTSNGGLSFELDVKPLMIKMLSDLDIDIYICVDPGYPDGEEKSMLDKFKNDDLNQVVKSLKIRKRQLMALIINQKNIKRFFDIKNIDEIGLETYKKLFNYYYRSDKAVQTTLF